MTVAAGNRVSELEGLIQHSFALQVPGRELRPAFAREGIEDTHGLLQALFLPRDRTGFTLGDARMQDERKAR
ncbi:MAG TPA: hypothetical protein VG518_06215, partial [Solirubrobacterales bacterium]|nr:hypothetical protein [Solirubrobacterales bacterium]